jgi:hypothetical protein
VAGATALPPSPSSAIAVPASQAESVCSDDNAGPPRDRPICGRRSSRRLKQMAASLDDGRITTVMIRNLPTFLLQAELTRELDRCGFAGAYDFCYLPCDGSLRRSKGFAFVNFLQPEFAAKIRAEWHGSTHFQIEDKRGSPLDVTAAHIQGYEANCALARSPHFCKIRNKNFRRLVVDKQQPSPCRRKDSQPLALDALVSSCAQSGGDPRQQRPPLLSTPGVVTAPRQPAGCWVSKPSQPPGRWACAPQGAGQSIVVEQPMLMATTPVMGLQQPYGVPK